MNKNIAKIFRSRILSAMIFFGIAGAIWGGWDLYGSTPPADYPLTIIGAILLGILGGLGLALPTRGVKGVLWVVLLGLIGAILGFIAAWVGIYNLSILGIRILAIFNPPADFANFLALDPKLGIASYWLNFALVGAFMGLFFAIGLRKKILPMVLRGAFGFGLAAIIGPILGNIIGNLFNSLLVNYILTFLIIGIVLGLSLSLKISKKEKEGSMTI
ncbi:MAG: hypothetical protein WAP23_01015 [Candidatus Spechtbacterales bacterium]